MYPSAWKGRGGCGDGAGQGFGCEQLSRGGPQEREFAADTLQACPARPARPFRLLLSLAASPSGYPPPR
jgi:hypothetical protein